MGQTAITASDNLRKQAWEEKLFRDTLVESYFMTRFGGQGFQNLQKGMPFSSTPNDLIHIKTNLEAKGRTKTRKGDKITFGLVPRIDPDTHPGVVSGQTLKNKEIVLSWYDFSLELERYRQAVSAGTPIDWHRASFAMALEARTALLNWGVEKMDLNCIDALDSSPTKIFYKTSSGVVTTTTHATAKSALTIANGKLTPQMVSFIATWAKTGGGRSYIPLRPIYVKGRPYFVILVHSDVIYDWKQDSTVFQAWREAKERGDENPIFQGASYIWDNCVIHEYENISIGTNAGSGSDVPYAQCYIMGAQALSWAWGERPSMVEETRDFEEELYYAWRMTAKVGKPVFNSKDYGSLCFLVSRTNVSGA